MTFKNLLNAAICMVAGILLIAGCSSPKPGEKTGSTTKPAEPAAATASPAVVEKPIAVQAKALTKEYDENELAADTKYKGKKLAVSGKISNIAETFGTVSVSLDGHNMIISVNCRFEDTEKDAVSKLKKGQQVTLVGTGDGSTAGLYVGLEKCVVQ